LSIVNNLWRRKEDIVVANGFFFKNIHVLNKILNEKNTNEIYYTFIRNKWEHLIIENLTDDASDYHFVLQHVGPSFKYYFSFLDIFVRIVHKS